MQLIIFIITSWIAADFISGLIHWAEDRYFRAEWPIIGKYVAIPNMIHHENSQAFLAGSYWTRNWTTIVPAAVAMALRLALPGLNNLWLAFLFLTQANEVHAWSHMTGKVNPVIHALQETGVLQSPRHHADHHRSPNMVRYCVLSNWLNPVLDSVRFWDLLEAGLRKMGITTKV